MNLRLLGVALVLPFLLNSCALLQLPANLINGVTAPLRRADNQHDQSAPDTDYIATEAWLALQESSPLAHPGSATLWFVGTP